MRKPIYILGLHNVRTGGPEAIHQLSDALIEQGFDARMVYYDWQQIARLEKAPTQDGYTFGERTNPIGEYERYKVNICGHVPNVSDAVVVLPETLCHLAPKFDKATVLVWWLSVDNAFGALAKVNLNHLRAPNVKHAWQSQYAAQMISALQLQHADALTDYITTVAPSPMPASDRPKMVLFNANHKVITDLAPIMEGLHDIDPEIECVPIRNMPRSSVDFYMAQARVYVDLGAFPGLDRMPREAARAGCSVLLSRHGAAGEFASEMHRFFYTTSETAVEYIAGLVKRPQPSSWFMETTERGAFHTEVRRLFSDL